MPLVRCVTYKINREECKKWLIERVDSNRDGKISMRDLHQAIQKLGPCFGWVKAWYEAWHAVKKLDINKNGAIDVDSELDQLINYAEKEWGIKFAN
ncbi:EF-hand-containing protein [Dioscorea alata]|uniref:EF-hand-containing protein n=1 Tax=Dioscorea alata TaxID=55571 RepID=A0ACB7TXQ2_DIOAL|nr:EF-hand-containing protein [Dioscorea alata]